MTDGSPTVLLTSRAVGDVNRSRILRAFCDHGPLSRADLARLAGVPRATIGAIVNGLMEDGLLAEEPGEKTGKVGKPGRPLWFRADAPLVLAVSFEPSEVIGARVNARGDVLERTAVTLACATATGDEVRAAVLAALQPLVAPHVLGVGIAVPGVVDTDSAVVLGSSQVPGSTGAELASSVSAALDLHVVVDNDARSQALGEKWFGDGRNIPALASLQTGEGIGVGLVLDGALHRGEGGFGGEIGQIPLVVDGALATWESIATLGWLRKQGVPGVTDAATLMASTEPGAAALRGLYARNLALGLAALLHLLGPMRVLLHGDVLSGGDAFVADVVGALKAIGLPGLDEMLDVRASRLDRDATLLGAAGLVLTDTFRLAR